MSFQFIIDNSSEISFNTKSLVAQTVARDGTTLTVSRGGQPWVFTVTLPDGPRWTDYRRLVAAAENLDRHTSSTVQFNNTGHDWLFAYQGDMTGTFSGTWTQGSTTLTVTGGTGTGYRFRAGDLIQLGTGAVYKVVADVASGSTSVTVHRPIIDADGSGTVSTGVDCEFTVRCVEFPEPRIFARNQLGWTGSFIFVEDLS